MLLQVEEFKDKVTNDIDALVTDLQFITGRYGEEEAKAWRASLAKVVQLFKDPVLDPLHVYFGSKGYLSLEYQLPASASWCDMVLLGAHQGQPSAVVVELKHWTTHSDKPGPVEGLIVHRGEITLHPSDQVRGYTEYCRRFHSSILDYNAQIHGCVLFTKDFITEVYGKAPNQELTEQYPCFTLSPTHTKEIIPSYFTKRLSEPHESFANDFENGTYKQDRGFVRQVGRQILDPVNSPFVLLDNQRRAFSISKANVDFAVFGGQKGPEKTVIIIKGPPGSGKSVVAAKIWASLVTNEYLSEGSVVFTTTSASQNSNWQYLFSQAGGDVGAGGVVKKATSYTPITTQQQKQLKNKYGDDVFKSAENWRDNMQKICDLGVKFKNGSQDNEYLISIIDEAHALINPEHKDGRGQFGFAAVLGPQAYQVLRATVVSIFLLDEDQSFRDQENTTIEDIKNWAKELNATVLETVSLEGAQFRCAGSKEYVDWLESVLAGNEKKHNRKIAKLWYGEDTTRYPYATDCETPYPMVAETKGPRLVIDNEKAKLKRLDFQIVDNPIELEEKLREKISLGHEARLLASYARQWKTKGHSSPHDLPAEMHDFYEKCVVGGKEKYWTKVWNFVPKGSDYTHYIQAAAGSRMSEDSLSEVGCSYSVRGFDYDYVGILWLNDLVWRDGCWVVNKDYVFETGVKKQLSRAKKEKIANGPEHQKLIKAIVQSYRILMTRAMKGVYVWIEDEETREYVKSSIANR